MIEHRILAALTATLLVAGCDSPEIAKSKAAVADQLKDPDSAKYSEIKLCDDNNGIRGSVNSKNSYGAYAGKDPFVVRNGVAAVGSDALMFEPYMRECDRFYAKASTDAAALIKQAEEATDRASDVASASNPETANVHRFPYVAPDGVDITNAQDEKNWRKYGTTMPNSGE